MVKPTKQIYTVGKKDTIKPKRGQKDRTVLVKIQCELNDDYLFWNAVANWKQGGIKNKSYVSSELGDIVHQVSADVRDGLIDLMGRVQEVDVIYKMPSGKDHLMTVTFKQAMRTI